MGNEKTSPFLLQIEFKADLIHVVFPRLRGSCSLACRRVLHFFLSLKQVSFGGSYVGVQEKSVS